MKSPLFGIELRPGSSWRDAKSEPLTSDAFLRALEQHERNAARWAENMPGGKNNPILIHPSQVEDYRALGYIVGEPEK